MRIGAFSRLGRVSIEALRHDEAIGLLRPAPIDAATGYRHDDERQFDALHRPMRERHFSSADDSRFDLTEIQVPLRPTQGVAA